MHEVASRKARGFSARGFSARGFSARGFSLVEMLLAVFILGVGVISIAALFPAGIVLQRQATDDIIGPLVAKNAFATIRSKLSPSDFGGFNDFGLPTQYLNPGVAGTIRPVGGSDIGQVSGDWGWMRPGFLFGTAADASNAGTIDIFSAGFTRQARGIAPAPAGPKATEIADGLEFATNPESLTLFGIPYNPRKYPLFTLASADRPSDPLLQQLQEPAITFTQAERSYPQGLPKYGATQQVAPNSSYYWDCMFRRNGGKVQVAVFIYRVTAPGGENRPYTVRANTTNTGSGAPGGAFDGSNTTPPIPALYLAPNFGTGTLATSWPNRTNTANSTAQGYSAQPTADEIPGTGINVDSFGSPEQVWDDWQAPASWWVDNHGSTHRVLIGRNNIAQGPVKLQRAIPSLPRSPVNGYSPTGTGANGPNAFISGIWFVPRRDDRGNVITPVFAAVEEL